MRDIESYGYYVFQNKIFTDRQKIADYMLVNEVYDGKIYFNYNDHVFSKIDWTKEVPFNLADLYRMRAEQLRQKYKYLVLSFSGGSDSTQVLMTFLRNNIFLDEIIIVNYNDAIKKIDENKIQEVNGLKIFKEYDLAAKPILDVFSKNSPKTKINVLDLSDFSFKQHIIRKTYDHICTDRSKFTNNVALVSIAPRTFAHYIAKYMSENATYNGAALIRGVDKPSLSVENDELFFKFYDIAYHGVHNFGSDKIDRIYDVEDFYWSPDFPFIPVKQCQVIKNEIETNKDYHRLFFYKMAKIQNYIKNKVEGHSPAWELERTYNEIIYPYWKNSIYAAPKPTLQSSEFTLWEHLGYKQYGKEIIEEVKSYTYKKYEKIQNKTLIQKPLSGKPYSIGKIQRRFYV